MKIVVIGGTGILGSKVVDKLRDHGDEAVAASPKTGVNTLTGEGFADVLTSADVVVDVSNSLGGIENFGGPEKISFEQMAREVLARQGEAKTVVVDPQVGYFGTPLFMNSLVTA
jgi:nucleoside-diphosphate-sugar epimerase